MSKLAGAAILGLVVGVLSGFTAGRAQVTSQQAAWDEERRVSGMATEKLRAQLEALSKLSATKETEALRLTEEVKALRAEVDAKNAIIAQSNSGLPEMTDDLSAAPPKSARDTPKKPGIGAIQAPQLPGRNELSNRLREGLQNYMDNEISKAQDPVVAQRLSALGESMQQQMEFVQQLRDAKTDEERETARQNLADLRSSMRGMVQEQQDSMLRQFAVQYGVTAPDKQDQFVQALRAVQSSPFFHMGGGFVTSAPAVKQ